MNDPNLMKTLKAILTELGIPEDHLHAEARLHQDLQLDSTEIVEMSLGLKRRLGIKLKLESQQDMTLAQVCQQIDAAQHAHSTHSPQDA